MTSVHERAAQTAYAPPSARRVDETIVAVAQRQARERPDALAYAYLEDGVVEASRLTFAELDRAARRVAAALLAVAQPGDRAVLVHETGMDFVTAFHGCLYAGIVAVPIPAPESGRVKASLPRLRAVAADCDAQLLLGTARTHALLRESGVEPAAIGRAAWLDTGPLAADGADVVAGDALPRVTLDRIAYLQYTSGSTSTPKGVMISHGNVVRHLAEMCDGFAYDASSVSVSWMPHFHDYGLIEAFLVPLYNGTPAYFMSPAAFIKRPVSWLEAMTRYGGTHTQAPNFAYRYCVRRIGDAQKRSLDLRTMRSLGNASEPIHPGTSDEFHAAFAGCGLRRQAICPAYGLAEATLIVSTTHPTATPVVGRFRADALGRGVIVPTGEPPPVGRDVAACGPRMPRTEIAIVDPETLHRAAPDRIGEVWAASDAIAEGYWRRPEESEATFRARILGEPERTWLRTGDLGFLFEEQLYITSRRKDLVIVRGINHHPQDIEWMAQQAHAALRPGNTAAFGIDVDGEERLGIVQELYAGEHAPVELDAIVDAMSRAVIEGIGIAPHVVVLIEQGTLPKTSSGKVQRRACRDGVRDGSLRAIHTWSATPLRAPTPPSVPDDRATEVDALLAWLRDYAERRVHSRLIDERRCVPPHIVLDFGNRGLFGLQAPRTLGGLGLGFGDTCRLYRQLGAIDLTLALLVVLHNANGLEPILAFATPAARDALVPTLAAGREIAAFALSEPGAGSHLGALATRAVPNDDGSWTLHGVKRWNGSAWAGVVSVFARVVDGAGRPRGIGGFLVGQTDAHVRVGPEALTMGVRGIMQNTLHLDGVRVPPERVLGRAGHAMPVLEHVLARGRLAIAAIAIGAAQRCAQLALRYASRREIDTGLLLDNPQLGARLSEVLHRVAVDGELLARCAATLDAEAAIAPEVAMIAKIAATDSANHAADLLMQALGGRGYMESNLAPQLLRDARLLSIGEGANESLLAAVGRSVRLGDAAQRFLHAWRPTTALADRLAACAATLDAQPTLGSYDGARAQPWRDALLARAAVAALGAAAAESLAARGAGEPETAAWAARRLDLACRDAEEAEENAAGLLSADRTRSTIAGYRDAIGDVEPLAPGVDDALDPLLQRDPASPPDAMDS
ncbi:MAG: AMP-binding protein [Gemmatirosa sp.]|nr:AMP-binding protein [Gemmatirosa sp.]